MRVLVTGGTGFVGQHLMQHLGDRGHTIFATYLVPPASKMAATVELLTCDMRKRNQILEVLRHVQPEQIYHLAGLSSVTKSFAESRQVWNTNVWGAMNLLDAVRETVPTARILLVGSGQCYGHVVAKRLPVGEDEALAPDNPYGCSKAAADLMGYQYFRNWNLQIIRARPFNHTGPGQPPRFVCSDLARQVAEIDLGLRPPLLQIGNTRVRRDFTDVRDVVRAYALLLERGTPGEAYNIASGRAVSVAEIVRHLQPLCSRRFLVKVEAKRLRAGEVAKVYGSYRKVRLATGWKPEYSLPQTLRDVYAYWKTTLRARAAYAVS